MTTISPPMLWQQNVKDFLFFFHFTNAEAGQVARLLGRKADLFVSQASCW